MTLERLLEQLHSLDVQLWLDEAHRLCYRVRKGRMSPELLEALRIYQDEVISSLRLKGSSSVLTSEDRGDLERVSLSAAQERAWYYHRLNPSAPTYNVAWLFRITGDIDSAVMQKSLESVANSHDTFRAVVANGVNGISLSFEPVRALHLPVVSLTDFPHEHVMGEVRRRCARVAREPFDLTHAPIFRAVLYRLGAAEHVLLLVTHHFAVDGRSLRVLLMEALSEAYSSILNENQVGALSARRTSIAEFVRTERAFLNDARFETELLYWKQTLRGHTDCLDLPLDHVRPSTQSFTGGRVRLSLNSKLSRDFFAVCRRFRATPFMGTVATIQMLLHFATGETDLTLGTAVSIRDQPDSEAIIGPLSNSLPIRTRLSRDRITFADVVGEVKTSVLGAFSHHHVPFEQIVAAVVESRSMAFHPLFQVMLAYHSGWPCERLYLEGASVKSEPVDLGVCRFDVNFELTETERGLEGWVDYCSAVLEEGTVKRLLKCWESLIQKVVSAPRRALTVDDLSPKATLRMPARATPVETRQPISFHQQRLLFIDSFERGNVYTASPVYHNVPVLIRVRGWVDGERLRAALQTLITSFPILRTRFTSDGEDIFREVEHTESVDMEFEQRWHENDDIAVVIPLALRSAERPFDLERQIPLRASLFKCANQVSLFLICLHHTVVDVASTRILSQALGTILSSGNWYHHSLTCVEQDGFDRYVRLEQNVPSERLENDFLYWNYLKSERAPPLILPFAARRPRLHVYSPSTCEFELDGVVTRSLRAISRQYGLRLESVLLAAFAALMARYGRQNRLSVGVLYDRRNALALSGTVGPLENLLALTLETDPKRSLVEFAKHVAIVLAGARRHGLLSFEEITKRTRPAIDMSRTAGFDIFFDFRPSPPKLEFGPGLDADLVETHRGFGKYDISLWLVDQGSKLIGTLLYNRKLIPHSMASRSVTHYRRLLTAFSSCPSASFASFDLLSKPEYDSELHRENASPLPVRVGTLVELFDDRARAHPETVALRLKKREISYGTLEKHSRRIATQLIKCGVRREELVALHMGRSIELVASMIGVMRAGAAFLPLDPDGPSKRNRFILGDAKVRFILFHDKPDPRTSTEEGYRWLDVASVSDDVETRRFPVLDSDQLAYCIYTSGTTGDPKGVLLEHRNLVRLFTSDSGQFSFTDRDVWCLTQSPAFDFSVWEIFGALSCGGRLVIVPDAEARDVETLARILADEGITIFCQTPSSWYQIADGHLQGPDNNSALRYVILGGEAVQPERLRRWTSANPGVMLCNMYGTTENGVHATLKVLTDRELSLNESNIGHPLPTVKAYVLDEQLRPVPRGLIGELYLGGSGLARGYLNRDDLTRDRFIHAAFAPTQRLYRTGDLASRSSSGELIYCGRVDDQLNIRGFRVEPSEVEIQLRQLPGVQDACVQGVAGTFGGRELVAYLVLESVSDMAALRSTVAKLLPSYMLPRHFITLDRIPLTRNGKLDRSALPLPTQHRPEHLRSFRPASNSIEAFLCALWCELLGLQEVGVDDDFFDLGGHSLSAARFTGRLQHEYGIELPLISIFECRTIARLAEFLGAKVYESETELTVDVEHDADTRFDTFPLTDIQQAFWVGRKLGFELGNVASRSYFEFDARGLDTQCLQVAWNKLVRRHDMLHAVVTPEGEQRVLKDWNPITIPVRDLRRTVPEAHPRELEDIREAMCGVSVDGCDWPVNAIRVTLLPGGLTKVHVVLDALFLDALSQRLLFKELGMLYQRPHQTLPAIDVSFRDCILALHRQKSTPRFERAMAYWCARLATLPPPPDLPTRVRPSELHMPRFRRRVCGLSSELWRAFKREAQSRGVSPTSVLLATFAKVLCAWSDRLRFTLNLTVFDRPPIHPQIDRVMGDFTSVLLFEVDEGNPCDITSAAHAVQRRLWQDLEHQQVSGVTVLRQRAKALGRATENPAPVVFTSLLSLPYQAERDEPWSWLGQRTFSHSQTPQVWIDHVVIEQQSELQLVWNSVDELFPHGMIDEMFRVYEALILRLAVATESWQIPHVELFAELPFRRIPGSRVLPNDASDGEMKSLFRPIVERTAEKPDHLALLCEDGTYTYGQLAALVELGAGRLRVLGLTRGELVAVVMGKSHTQIAVILSLMSLGCAYLPIDPKLPVARLAQIISSSGVRWVIGTESLEHVRKGSPHFTLVRPDALFSISGALPGSTTWVRDGSPDDLAYVIYTSGTTGEPKGVMVQHRSASNTVCDVARRIGLGPKDRVIGLSPVGFDLSVFDIFGTLSTGAGLVLPDPNNHQDPAHWIDLITRLGVTVWNSVPAMAEILVQYLEEHCSDRELPLRAILLSGDWIPTDLPGRLRKFCQKTRVISLGGATEAGIWSLWHEIGGSTRNLKTIPYGKALAGQSVHVLDELLQPCPVWAVGNLWIGGKSLAKGYLGDPDMTSKSFVQLPPNGERGYHTGDRARWLPDETVELLGRSDDQVKVLGYRIEPREIEIYLERAAVVDRAAVVAVGETSEQRRLVAFVVPRGDRGGLETERAITDFEYLAKWTNARESSRRTDLDGLTRVGIPDSSVKGELPGEHRHSVRQFSRDVVPFERFGAWIGCIAPASVRSEQGGRSYGSAGGVYPVQLYVFCKPGRIENLNGGAYYFDPDQRELACIPTSTDLTLEAVDEPNRRLLEGGAFMIVLAAAKSPLETLYKEEGQRYLTLEAGAMTQLLEMTAAAHSIGVCQIGRVNRAYVRELFSLEEEALILNTLIGGGVRARECESKLNTRLSAVLREHLSNLLPGYMLPSEYKFLTELPLTSAGKIDRGVLSSSVVSYSDTSAQSVEFATTLEHTIANLFREVLGVSSIDRQSNFYELGGNSMGLIRLHARLMAEFDTEFPITAMFEHRTVQTIASYISRLSSSGSNS